MTAIKKHHGKIRAEIRREINLTVIYRLQRDAGQHVSTSEFGWHIHASRLWVHRKIAYNVEKFNAESPPVSAFDFRLSSRRLERPLGAELEAAIRFR